MTDVRKADQREPLFVNYEVTAGKGPRGKNENKLHKDNRLEDETIRLQSVFLEPFGIDLLLFYESMKILSLQTGQVSSPGDISFALAED